MKIINFYSYKGGVGRTMLTLQMARCLAALGKNVVAVDFDFDAPGLPLLFNFDISTVKGGIVELVDKFNNTRESDIKGFTELIDCLNNDYLISIDKEEYIKKNGGKLRILPSGKVGTGYFDRIASTEWYGKLVSEDEEKDSFISFVNNALRPALEKIGVEYLLIDARSGISCYSSIAQYICTHQVILTCKNNESSFSLKNILLPSINQNEEEGYNKDIEKFLFIICRVPSELNELTNSAFNEMESLIEENLCVTVKERTKVLKIHSDMKTHIIPESRYMDERFFNEEQIESGDLEVVQLHEDYLKILAALCSETKDICENILKEDLPEELDEEMVDDENNELNKLAHAIWKKIYEHDFKITVENRLFGFLDTIGAMNNPDDNQRNIAFKVETYLNFLNEFYSTLNKHENINGYEIMIRALYNAGEQCGKKFGKSLVELLKHKKKFNAREYNIKEWCRFDTQAGFGLMKYTEKDRTLTVENLFIMNAETTEGRDFTPFFTGYVIGVLGNLISKYELEALEMKKISNSKADKKESVSSMNKGDIVSADDAEDYEFKSIFEPNIQTPKKCSFSKSKQGDTGIAYRIGDY